MKKFTQFASRSRRIFEQEISLQNNEDQNKDGVQVQVQVQPNQGQQQDSSKVEKSPESEHKSDPAKFFSKLFESREMAHVYHLQVKGDQGSYAAHIALAEYYNAVLELIDDLVEIYQGQYDLVSGYETIDTSSTNSKDKIEYFKELAQFISKNKFVMISKDDTHLQNVIDEISSLVYKLLYKLRFNK